MAYERHTNRPELLTRRRRLRREQTYAERSLWSQLRASRHGAKFRRQHSIGNFILDLYCAELKLAIEIDGASHDLIEVKRYDAKRQAILEAEGITFLRFTDEEVLHDANRTLEKIAQQIEIMRASNLKSSSPEREKNKISLPRKGEG